MFIDRLCLKHLVLEYEAWCFLVLRKFDKGAWGNNEETFDFESKLGLFSSRRE